MRLPGLFPGPFIGAFVITFTDLLESGAWAFSLPRWQAPRPRQEAAALPAFGSMESLKAVGLLESFSDSSCSHVTPYLISHSCGLSPRPLTVIVRGEEGPPNSSGRRQLGCRRKPTGVGLRSWHPGILLQRPRLWLIDHRGCVGRTVGSSAPGRPGEDAPVAAVLPQCGLCAPGFSELVSSSVKGMITCVIPTLWDSWDI